MVNDKTIMAKYGQRILCRMLVGVMLGINMCQKISSDLYNDETIYGQDEKVSI